MHYLQTLLRRYRSTTPIPNRFGVKHVAAVAVAGCSQKKLKLTVDAGVQVEAVAVEYVVAVHIVVAKMSLLFLL